MSCMRIFHGPINIGGIGRYFADWQRERGAISDFVTYFDHPRKKNKDYLYGLYLILNIGVRTV